MSRPAPALPKKADEYNQITEASETSTCQSWADWLLEKYSSTTLSSSIREGKMGMWREVCDVHGHGAEGHHQGVLDSKWMFATRARGFVWDTPITGHSARQRIPTSLLVRSAILCPWSSMRPRRPWDPIKASGLPTVAHIPATLDNLKVDESRGATGAIVAGRRPARAA